MYFDREEDERDPFDLFGEAEPANDDPAPEFEAAAEEPQVVEPETPHKIKTGFSWAGFAGGVAALVWIAGAIGGPLSYFGVDAVLGMDPAMQAGLLALAFGPALLFWVSASAAGEAMKARRLATELARIAQVSRLPFEAGEEDAQRLSNSVKNEIETLNEAVASALDRLAELETAAQRNVVTFGEAVAASRDNTDAMARSLRDEREALAELNGEIKGQTDVLANSIGRQIRLMREASKLVKTEITAAEDALESHVASFNATAGAMGERTAHFHQVASDASAATSALNGTMSKMLDGLTEATRLTDAARKSTAEAVMAANETAGAVRETTRAAVFEAKRAAQLIRAETVALQDAAAETLVKLQEAAAAARAASAHNQFAADQHAATLEKRMSARTSSAAVVKKAAQRPVERQEVVAEAQTTTLHAAANAAVARTARPRVHTETVEAQPRRVFKGFGGWGNFMPPQQRDEAPIAANEDEFDLVDFRDEPRNSDADLQAGAIDVVLNAGVDLDDVLNASDLDRIARNSRDGASARRRAVTDAAPAAVGRIARHVKRSERAHEIATQFRSRPDLAKSEKKGEGSDLVRAYLLIDAALA